MDVQDLLTRIDQPEELESLYRRNPAAFRKALHDAHQIQPGLPVLAVWKARLDYKPAPRAGMDGLKRVLLLALAGGTVLRIATLLKEPDWVMPRLAPLLILLGLSSYFWAERRNHSLGLMLGIAAGISAIWALWLPGEGDSVQLSLAHLPLVWWSLLGLSHAGLCWQKPEQQLSFLRFNGELLILGSLVASGAAVFSALTIGLFMLLIDQAGDWYANNVGVYLILLVPLMACWLYDQVFARSTGIPTMLVRIFAPLFLIMGSLFLLAALLMGKSPFLDRDFLIVVNGLLLIVMAMTMISIAERDARDQLRWQDWVHTGLLILTLLIDLLALSSIAFRLASWGFTPNRLVVLGMNLVLLPHLVRLAMGHVAFLRGRSGMERIHAVAGAWLPVYALWALLVTVVLPLLFRFS
jgi:hypothetical protein